MNRSICIHKRYCFMFLANGDRPGGNFEKEEEHSVFKCKNLPSNVLFINFLERALIAHFAHRIVTPFLSGTFRSLPWPPISIANFIVYCSWSSGTFQNSLWLVYANMEGSSQTRLLPFSTHFFIFPVSHCCPHFLFWMEYMSP